MAKWLVSDCSYSSTMFLLAVTSIMIIITILLINMVHGPNASFNYY